MSKSAHPYLPEAEAEAAALALLELDPAKLIQLKIFGGCQKFRLIEVIILIYGYGHLT